MRRRLTAPLAAMLIVLVAVYSAPAIAQSPSLALVADYTVWNLVRNMDGLVKTVMVLLLLASLITWTVCIAKSVELVSARAKLKRDLAVLNRSDSMNAVGELASDAGKAVTATIRVEMARGGNLRESVCAEGIKERVTVRLLSIETSLARRMTRGVNIVASVGATAPFVGLFGTVWGIMDSFVGIAKMQSTNLSVVAPGVAEALLTTAMGLAAAVPAVLIYNGLSRALTGYRALLADVSNAAACVLSLDLEKSRLGTVDRAVSFRDAARGV